MNEDTPVHSDEGDGRERRTRGESELAAVKLRALDQLPVPACLFDRRRLLIAANRVASEAVGRTERQLLGLRPGELDPGRLIEGTEDLDRVVERVLDTGEELTYETYIRPGGDTAHAWRAIVTPVTESDGTVSAVSVITLDTTEQYRARRRMAFLSEAGLHIGSTLDITRTAEELAEFAVSRLADFVTVELLEPVSAGETEPPEPGGTLVFRRGAQRSVLQGCPESVVEVGATHTYAVDGPVGKALASGRAERFDIDDDSLRWWAGDLPERARSIRRYGIHSMILAPLRARGSTLGFTIFCRHRTAEPFDDNDLMLVEELAARSALSVDNARRYTHERATALALQRSMLPQRAPRQPAVDVATRYVPNVSRAGIAGDWFDVIPLSGARVALVVGDVVGRGIRASATMARLRAAVWTLADVDLAPEELLTQLDDLVLHLDQEVTAAQGWDSAGAVGSSFLYAVYDPISGCCTMARAGHPAPLLVSPEGTAEFLDVPSGPPLGLGGLPFEAVEFQLPEGAVLAFYTDGLIKIPRYDVDAALEALRGTLAHAGPSLEQTCDTVMSTLQPDRPADDIVLLLARTCLLDTDRYATWDLPADPAALAGVRKAVGEKLAEWGLEEATFITELVASELVTNAIRYGGAPIRLRLIRDSRLICEVTDGSSTAPHLRRARTYDEGGRGLLLVAQLTQRWGTRYIHQGKTIWAEQTLPDAAPDAREEAPGAG